MRPSGRVTQVCRTSAERQGAYDLLNSKSFGPGALHAAVVQSTLEQASEGTLTMIAIDGTSLSLVDRAGEKDFGSIGARSQGGRGIKFLNAYAMEEDGTPIGLLRQDWWLRPNEQQDKLPVHERESQEWVDAVNSTSLLLRGWKAPGWYQLDREGDNGRLLAALAESGQLFTVRSSHGDRRLVGQSTKRLRHLANAAPVSYRSQVQLPGRSGRRRRTAQVAVRATSVELDLGKLGSLSVNVVDVKEAGRVPAGEKALHWRLLTNHPVNGPLEAARVIHGYRLRWRVEEFHKTWKSGACAVEETQLRSAEAVVKWAIVMAATATRIERLKYLHRNEPGLPATEVLTKWEIMAAIILRKKYKKRTDPAPKANPTIGEIMSWIADFGGYTGKSSGGPPGSIVLRRGMEVMAPLAAGLEQMAEDGQL